MSFPSLKEIWYHKGDLFWLPWTLDYTTVEQPRVCLLHYCRITSLISPSQETYSEESQAMLPHSPGDIINDVGKFFSIIITFKSISFIVFTVAGLNETALQSKLCGPLLCSSGFLLWTGRKGISLSLSSFLTGNDFLNSLVKYPSGVPRLRLGESQLLFLCERNIT